MNLQKKEYYLANKAKIAEKQKIYYINNRDIILKKKKEAYNKRRSSRIKLTNEELSLNKRLNRIKYYEKNKHILNKGRYKYRKKLMELNPTTKITHNLRIRIKDALLGKRKLGNLVTLVGLPIDQLRSYLETLFKPDMSWDNYGEWHIDHIRPCASFDLSIPENQLECFNYKNLQPLWATDNIKKGKIYPIEFNDK